MASIEELKEERLRKIQLLKDAGMNPYPSFSRANKDMTIQSALEQFDELSKNETPVNVSGRIMAMRGQGALIFLDIKDGSAKVQALMKKGDISDELFDLSKATLDIGDFIEVEGVFFITKRGERSVLVHSWKMLSKSLQPLPDKWHGISDEELRYRKRYLDILLDDDLRSMLEKKSHFWRVVRTFMDTHNFAEVETPVLETTTGGAEARPFTTHHNDFDIDVFLRISVGELWQKRLLTAGMDKTYEIGRTFRNEGSSPNHLQEFTNMEFYWSYANYEDAMNLVEQLYKKIAQEVFGTTSFTTGEHTYDLGTDWGRISYNDEVLAQTGIDLLSASDEEIKNKLKELHVSYEGDNRERLTDTLWKYCRKHISGPVFLVDHPKLVSPLAKAKNDNPDLTERFQIIIAGAEVGNGYTELNDPIEQKARFDLQQQLLEGGDDEAMMPDEEFVEALEHGMPPACGFGFGERLFAFLVDKPIRETQFFPLMKPKQ